MCVVTCTAHFARQYYTISQYKTVYQVLLALHACLMLDLDTEMDVSSHYRDLSDSPALPARPAEKNTHNTKLCNILTFPVLF